VINGTKVFISGAGETDVLVVMLRTGGDGPKGITAVLVPADAAGISYGKKEEKMGWNAQPTRMVSFDNVRVPVAQSPRRGGAGICHRHGGPRRRAHQYRHLQRRHGAAGARGGARLRAASGSSSAQAIADFQATQFKLADMLTDVVAARQMVRLAASKLDAQDPQATTYCAMAKRFATDAGFRVCNEALQLFGGYGYIREYPMERHVRDTRVHQILEGTNEIMRVIIARA
jgi:alkylation response protein AidB-like acyl-CoA dehydrogenase